MLTLLEELLVLLMDEHSGEMISVPKRAFDCALAGAALLDLVEERRIDTDTASVFIIDPTPLGDDLLDPILAELAQQAANHPEPLSPEAWVRRVAENADELHDQAAARLAAQGILEIDDAGLISLSRLVFRSRRYSAAAAAQPEIHLRLMGIIFGDELPDPRDVAIISLANACGAFQRMLSADEYAQVRNKIDLYSGLFRSGRAVANAIRAADIADTQAQRHSGNRRRDGGWPKARGLPLLGNALQMNGGLINFMTDQYHKLGPVFEMRAFKQKFVVIAGPEANLFLLREGKNHFRSRDRWESFNRELGAAQSVVSMNGGDHTRMRQAMRSGYSRGLIERRIADADAALAAEIAELPLDRDISVFPAFQSIVTEILGTVSGSMSSRRFVKDLRTFLDTLLKVHMVRTHPSLALRTPKARRARRQSYAFFEQVLTEHSPEARAGAEHRDLIDDLLDLNRNSPDLMSEADLWFPVMGPFIVGMHTVAATASYLLYSLLEYPDLMARVQAEADDVFSQGPPTAQDVQRLTDTTNATLETMRLYPIVPGLGRTVANSFEFAGYRIPAGANLIVATPVTNRLPEYFPDPDRFDISRFTPERRRQHARPGIYAPFGLGAHSCLGQGLTQVLIPFVIAGLLHRRQVAMSRPGYRIKSKHTPLPRPHGNFKIRLSLRS